MNTNSQTPETSPATTAQESVDKSKFDQALIDFLGSTKNQDIIFEVKKQSGGNFNNDLQDSDLNTPTFPLKVRVQVKVTDSMQSNTSNDTFKFTPSSNGDPQPLKAIRDLNKGKPWTWSCDIEFKKATGATKTALDETTKKQIMATGDKGLFGILKKDVFSYTDGEETKWKKADLRASKKTFVDLCAKARGENKTILGKSEVSENDLNIAVPSFELQDGSGDKTEKLVPKISDTFNSWFKSDYGTKDYHTSA